MNPDLRHLDPIQQALLIHTAECEIAEISAWSRAAKRAGDRIKMRANITRQKKLIRQAKHAH